MSTYSWPESFPIARITSSVTARSTRAIGRLAVVAGEIQRLAEPHARRIPKFGRIWPEGMNSNVPTIAHGTTGARPSRASRAMPVLPRYSRPSGLRVPSG